MSEKSKKDKEDQQAEEVNKEKKDVQDDVSSKKSKVEKKKDSKASSRKEIKDEGDKDVKKDDQSVTSKKSKSKKGGKEGPEDEEDAKLKTEDQPGNFEVPQAEYKSAKKSTKNIKNPTDEDEKRGTVTNLGSISKMTFNPSANLDMNNINEIRKKREEERIKEMNFFKNQKQFQIAKILEVKQKEKQVELERERKRKRRHSNLKKQIVDLKQAQTERRKSIDEQYNNFISQKYKKRAIEVSRLIKAKNKEYDLNFKKQRQLYLRKKKEREAKKAVQERGISKGIEAAKAELLNKEQWDEIKQERAVENKIFNMFYSGDIEEIIRSQDKQLFQVYTYYSRIILDPIEQRLTGAGSTLPMRNFFLFANQFEFLKTVLDVPELKNIYRSVSKDRKIGGGLPLVGLKSEQKIDRRLPVGLTFEEFKLVLFRVVLKNTSFFSKVPPPEELKYIKTPNIEFVDIYDHDFLLYDDIKDLNDDYPLLKEFHYSHIDGLFNFMDLPTDEAELNKKLDGLRRAYFKVKPNEVKDKPKKRIFEIIHHKNEVEREKYERLYGPSEFRIRKERIRSARQQRIDLTRSAVMQNKMRSKSALKRSAVLKGPSAAGTRNSIKELN